MIAEPRLLHPLASLCAIGSNIPVSSAQQTAVCWAASQSVDNQPCADAHLRSQSTNPFVVRAGELYVALGVLEGLVA